MKSAPFWARFAMGLVKEGNKIKLSRKAVLREQREKLKAKQ